MLDRKFVHDCVVKEYKRGCLQMFIRKIAKLILYNRKINPIVRLLIRPLSPLISIKLAVLLPVLCKFSVKLPEGYRLTLEESKGQDTIARILYWKGFKGYEYETARLFFALSRQSKVILDVGANIGYYTFLAALKNSSIRVYTFEPVPRVYTQLKRNVELNKCSNVETVCSAVTSFNGDIMLYIPKSDIPVSSSTLKGFRESEEEYNVPAITLDSFVNEKHIIVDLMKIDTEAIECDVLEGSQIFIQRDRPVIFCEVLKDRTEKALEEFFHNRGYVYYWITVQGLIRQESIEGDGTYKYNNYLFCPKEKAADIETKFGVRK